MPTLATAYACMAVGLSPGSVALLVARMRIDLDESPMSDLIE